MNVELFQEIRNMVLAKPEQVDMDDFMYEGECGTVGCIAGWACVLTGNRDTYHPARSARHLLAISEEQSDRLFYTGTWPAEIRSRIRETGNCTPEHAALVVERIDQFLASDGSI